MLGINFVDAVDDMAPDATTMKIRASATLGKLGSYPPVPEVQPLRGVVTESNEKKLEGVAVSAVVCSVLCQLDFSRSFQTYQQTTGGLLVSRYLLL